MFHVVILLIALKPELFWYVHMVFVFWVVDGLWSMEWV